MDTKQSNSQKILRILPILCLLGVFFCLALYRLDAVEPEWDEATNINFAVTLLHGGNPFATNALLFFPSLSLPPMTCFYTGSFVLFLKFPAMLLFGTSLIAIRAGFAIFAGLGLVGLFFTLRYLLSPSAAFLCTMLTAFNTLFIRASRMSSEHEEITTLSLFWIGSALICHFAKNRKKVALGFAGFFWGLALFTKLMAGVYFAGLGLVFVLFRKQILSALKLDKKHIALFATLFCIGVFPYLNYTVSSGAFVGGIKNLIVESVDSAQSDNSMTDRLKMRIDHLGAFLRQSNITDHVNPEEGFLPILPIAVILFCLMFLFSRQRCPIKLKIIIVTVFIMSEIIFTSLLFTPQNNTPAHMLALIPFIEILIAVVFYFAMSAKTRQIRIAVLAVLVPCILFSFVNEARMLRNYFVMSKKRGTYKQSEQKALDYIRRNNLKPVYAAHMRKGQLLTKYLYPGLPVKFRKQPNGTADIYILHSQTNSDMIINWNNIEQRYNLSLEKISDIPDAYYIYKASLSSGEDFTNLSRECGGLNYLYINE